MLLLDAAITTLAFSIPRLSPRVPRLNPRVPMCERAPSLPSAPLTDGNGRLTKNGKRHLSQLLKRLPDMHESSDEGCAMCLNLMEEIRSLGLDHHAGANVHNHAMRLCASRLDEVERLFDDLLQDGHANEASYAMLMQAQVEHGEVERARASLEAMLVNARVAKPKLRSCAPLLRQLCAMNETTASVELWERLARRGVEFTATEYAVRMRMHGRTGDALALQRVLSMLLERDPTPTADTVEAIYGAMADLATATGTGAAHPCGGADDENLVVQHVTLDDAGVCSCCGTPMQLLGLDAAERARVRETLLERASSRSASGYEHLREYVEWLRVRPPFDYVLDGPNVAYFNQNWEEGAFSFKQIQDVMCAHRPPPKAHCPRMRRRTPLAGCD